MSITRLLPLLAAAALAGGSRAQTAPELIGLVDGPGAPVLRQDMSTCAARICPTLMAAITARPAGGTAYDATRGAVWLSNGADLWAVDPIACRVVCAPHSLPAFSNAPVTGLAVNESEGVLVVTDAANVISQYELECPVVTLASRCDATGAIPAGHTIGGVATDDVSDLVIYSSSSFGPTVNPDNTIYVARRADPCNVLCRIDVPSCGGTRLRPITGVGFDPCKRVIWATDGLRTVGLRLAGPAVCSVQEIQCCTLPTNRELAGLCVMPSQATAVGQSCTNFGCPTCSGMAHVTVGDPALGNPSFSLDLVDAPRGARAALWVGGGPCHPSGVLVRPFCGPILVPLIPPPIVINVTTGPGVGCGGGFRIPVPIPLDRSLCGGTLSSQAFGLCSTAAVGTFVSNCLSWTVTGS